MAGQTFRVEFTEGGEGMVFDGDPAYSLCRELSKIGYVRFVMPRITFLTGNTDTGYVAKDNLSVIAWEDQRETLGHDSDCVKHYYTTALTCEDDLIDQGCDACGHPTFKPTPRFLKRG